MEQFQMSTPTLLRRRDASRYLRERYGFPYAPQTLAKLACIGGGPRFMKWGRWPVYSPDDLDAWVASKLTGPLESTSTPSGRTDSVMPSRAVLQPDTERSGAPSIR
jgi:hypothetical protein